LPNFNGLSLQSRIKKLFTLWWVHQDSNLGPAGYEPVALTAELWTPGPGILTDAEKEQRPMIFTITGR
jgi:hypothetical protein